MSATQHASSPTWAEPPWSGWIETTGDALLILEAARRGLIPRVTRRLVDSERKMITSGSVFVFDEDESGIKRWTDGFFWSPSRILGNFLLYRETDKKGSNQRNGKDVEPVEFDSSKADGTLSRPKTDPGHPGVDKQRERTLVGSLTNSYKFKPDGLMKKTFSLTIGGVAQHLISYYKVEDVESGRLRPPSSLPELASLEISPEYLDKTHFRNPPKTEMGADRVLRYRGEADDIDTSASLITGPPLTGLPLLSGGREVSDNVGAKRAKRYEPYATPVPPSKRPRKSQGNTLNSTIEPQQSQSLSDEQDGVATPIASPASPQPPQQQAQAPQIYPEPNAPVTSPGVPSTPITSYPSFGVPQYYGYVQPPHVPIYSHQAPYTTVSPQGIPPPSAHHGQYTYVAYPPPMPNTHQSSSQAPVLAQSSPPPGSASASIISPSDPSHPAGASPSTQPIAQSQPIQPTQIPPGYYHPPTLQPAYFATPHGPPTAPHPQMYSAYPPPPPHVAPPSGAVWGPPPGHHTVPHPYGAYAAPPQQYSYGMYAAPPPQQGYQQPQPQPQPQQPQQYFQPQMQPQGYAHISRPEEAQNPENGKTNGHAGRDGVGDEEAGNGE